MLKEKSLLWTMLDVQSNTLSYLYGTMHVQSSIAYKYAEQLKPVIKSKPYFYSETNLDDLAEKGQDQSIFSIPHGKTLSNLITQNRYRKWILTVKKHFGIDLENFDRFLPFITTQYLQSHYLSADHMLSLDNYLWEYARDEERILGGIESVEFQANVMKQISMSTQLKMLKDFLSNPNKYKKQLEVLAVAYMDQDVYQLHKITSQSLGGLRRLMLKDRNHRMAEVILNNSTRPSVYTFGAAHLAGNHGVLALLKRGGLTIKAKQLYVETTQ